MNIKNYLLLIYLKLVSTLSHIFTHLFIYIYINLYHILYINKIVKNEYNLCCKGADPWIYENSIFQAYVPEKNKIITPCSNSNICQKDPIPKCTTVAQLIGF